MRIGVIGFGFVGATYANGLFKLGNEIRVYDPYKEVPKEYGNNTFEEVAECPIIFTALPTIPKKDGSEMDLTPYEETFEKLVFSDSIIVIKSTVLPGTTRRLSKKYNLLNLMFMPEFLTERTAMSDFMTQDRILLGTIGRMDLRVFYKLFEKINCPIIVTDAETAELAKFASNSFFATKVAFANEFSDIAKTYGVSWEEIKKYLYMDPRIGSDHLTVYENNRGFGGHCLPKDTYQLYCDLNINKGFNPYLLEQIINYNARLRKKKKWEA